MSKQVDTVGTISFWTHRCLLATASLANTQPEWLQSQSVLSTLQLRFILSLTADSSTPPAGHSGLRVVTDPKPSERFIFIGLMRCVDELLLDSIEEEDLLISFSVVSLCYNIMPLADSAGFDHCHILHLYPVIMTRRQSNFVLHLDIRVSLNPAHTNGGLGRGDS